MDIKNVNLQIELLENDYDYWLKQKEALQSIVEPSSPKINVDKVKGGRRIDKFLQYVEIEDEKKINDTLDYIQKRKLNLINWLSRELKILNRYGEVESLIVQYREKGYFDEKQNKFVRLTWEEISKKVHYSETFCRNVYRNYKKIRNVD